MGERPRPAKVGERPCLWSARAYLFVRFARYILGGREAVADGSRRLASLGLSDEQETVACRSPGASPPPRQVRELVSLAWQSRAEAEAGRMSVGRHWCVSKAGSSQVLSGSDLGRADVFSSYLLRIGPPADDDAYSLSTLIKLIPRLQSEH